MSLVSRPARALDRKIWTLRSRRSPVLSGPAPALEGGLGKLPFAKLRAAILPMAEDPDFHADHRPWYHLNPAAITSKERAAFRQAGPALAALEGRAEDACRGIEHFLSVDQPGRGAAWAHSTDLTARLIHWLAAIDWLGKSADLELRRKIAGSVKIHEEHLEQRLFPAVPGDPRRLQQLVGIITARLGWPALFERFELGLRLNRLLRSIDDCFFSDGSPRVEHSAAPQLVDQLLIVKLLLEESGYTLPLEARARLESAALFVQLVQPSPDPRFSALVLPFLELNPVKVQQDSAWSFHRFEEAGVLSASRGELQLLVSPSGLLVRRHGKLLTSAKIPCKGIETHLGTKVLKVRAEPLTINVNRNFIIVKSPGSTQWEQDPKARISSETQDEHVSTRIELRK